MKRKKTFFDEDLKLEKLANLGDHLLKLDKNIDWEVFRATLDKAFKVEPKSPGGRPPYDRVMMFKLIVLQRFYNLSDDEMEFQMNDRLTFMRFLGLELQDDVPDAKTIWHFKDVLNKKKAMKTLFKDFDDVLKEHKLVGSKGTMVDATFIEAPIQRNTREENKEIKNGKVPEDWQNNVHKISQKDTDARWAKKNGQRHYGYKDHIKIDGKTKFIEAYAVTNASVHDSQVIAELLYESDANRTLYADSAYYGEPIKNILEEKKIKDKRHKKGCRNNPLSKKDKAGNRKKSRLRARVEHIFGYFANSMRGTNIRVIGIERAETAIGLTNLTYNLCRFAMRA